MNAGAERTRYIVLDDDPTGTQSVADVPVLTSWSPEDLSWAFAQDSAAIYVLTNSRSLSTAEAERVTREVVTVALASCPPSTSLEFVSRSDSTLRGHFPLETDVIEHARASAGEPPVDVLLLVPAFPEAGRITRAGVHYARSASGELQPVGQSEYASDATFGYSSSWLPDWVEEKSNGHLRAADVTVVDLEQIRSGEAVLTETLVAVHGVVACDCETPEDLDLLVTSVHAAQRSGQRFLFRAGPPLARALIGQAPRPEVPGQVFDEIYRSAPAARGKHGLVVVGSHVPTTTRQLAVLRERRDLSEVQLDVADVLAGAADRLEQIVAEVVSALATKDTVLSTSRTVVHGDSRATSLSVARQVSAAVVEVVRGVLAATRPRFVVAKGGITSSDVATCALQMRRAWAHGSMLPGIVSLWSTAHGPAAGIPYVVFPGNVGDDHALSAVVERFDE